MRDHIEILFKFVLEFAIEDWSTNCRLRNVDYGRVQSVERRIGDHIEILLKLVLEFAIEYWSTNCRIINVDYGRVLAQSNDGLGIILEFY